MKKIAIPIIILMTGFGAAAQQNGKQVVDKLLRLLWSDFKYAETFSPYDANYKYHERDETGGTAELALPIEVSDKKIVIQHLLVVGPNAVVKHWREEWTYENTEIWKYKGDRVWVKETVPAEQVKVNGHKPFGKWPMNHVTRASASLGISMARPSGKIQPMHRFREENILVRSDYNVLKRTNCINITDSGYVHEQDNQKIIRTNGTDKLLVEEKGLNTYKTHRW